MSDHWDKVYSSDKAFFGEEPSEFATLCYQHMRNVRNILELGCGHGRDTLFFASKGISVDTFDYSKVAIDTLLHLSEERKLRVNAIIHDARKGLPFSNSYFDAVYSHMFFSMGFSNDELSFLFHEVARVLKNDGLHLFSVRSEKDILYKKGIGISDNIYDINGFRIRFFSKEEIKSFANDFLIYDIIESYEEPASLYFVFSVNSRIMILQLHNMIINALHQLLLSLT